MYYTEERNEVHPFALGLMICFGIYFLDKNFPIFHLIVSVVIAAGIFAAAWRYLGKRFLLSAAFISASALWAGGCHYAHRTRDAALKLATESSDPFLLVELKDSHTLYHEPWFAIMVGLVLLGVGIGLFWKEW